MEWYERRRKNIKRRLVMMLGKVISEARMSSIL